MGERALIYRRLVGARIRAQMQYRVSFALALAGSFLATFMDFVAITAIFLHVPALGGWSIPEVAFLYAVTSLSFGFTDLAIGHLDSLPGVIRSGAFDSILLRPLGSLLQVVSLDIAIRRIGKVLQGLAVLVYAISRLDVAWTPARIAMIPMMVVSGIVIFAGIWIAGSTIAFWTIDSMELVNSLTYGGNFLTQYPLNVFNVWLRRFLAFIVPMAFINYLPSVYVLSKPDALGLPVAFRFLSPAVAVATAAFGVFAWRFAVRHYRSTGS